MGIKKKALYTLIAGVILFTGCSYGIPDANELHSNKNKYLDGEYEIELTIKNITFITATSYFSTEPTSTERGILQVEYTCIVSDTVEGYRLSYEDDSIIPTKEQLGKVFTMTVCVNEDNWSDFKVKDIISIR